ncbi:MAG: cysteine dioxygenase [Jatrophihabitans sp.]|uniref:cysteine dioxygenase n=1 Tax=Jatrophihabitans sp. TaxID=1932789 RepID=UPI003F806395
MPSAAPSALYFAPSRLREWSRFFADEVAAGKCPWVDYDADDRWHQRIYRDQRMDVWLISWLPTQGTQLHDHGGSAGSFTVLSGELTETVVTGAAAPGGARARDLVRGAGSTVGFGARYVHDVRNLGTAPAVSVHVYSAPLSSMTYYDLADGRLQPLMTVETDDPELELEIAS